MIRFETEIQELRTAGLLDEAAAQRALALDRGSVFSLYEEFRVAMYAAVTLISVGLGLLLKHNLERIGPLTLLIAILVAAAVCYATALRSRRQGVARTVIGDYLLLLGALLLSAAAGYAESQFHWLGDQWARQLLILTIVHGVAAYYFDSRLVLSLALTAFAAWFGIEPRFGNVFAFDQQAPPLGWRALQCALLVFLWRMGERWLRGACAYREIYDHFALNLAFGAALVWCFQAGMRIPAVLLLLVLAGVAIAIGRRRASEIMLVYGVTYPAFGLAVVCARVLREPLLISFTVLAIIAGAVTLLWRLRALPRVSR